MKQIFINGQALDISDQEPIALTLQVNNIAELKDRQANYTNEISIPLTSSNRIILGNPEVVSTYSVKPYKRLQASYLENGIIVIPEGVAEVISTKGNFAGIVLYSGIKDFFSIIKDKKLSDLDMTSFNHIWNAETAAALNEGGGDETKCIYPITQTGAMPKVDNPYELWLFEGKYYIDSGHTESGRAGVFAVQYQVPAVYFKVLIDKIFEEAGYTKEGNVFSDTLYQKMILSCNGDLLLPQKYLDERSCIVGTYDVLYKSVVAFGPSANWGPFIFPWNNESEISNYNNRLRTGPVNTGYSDGALDCFKPMQNKYVAAGSYTILIEATLPFLMDMTTQEANVKIAIKKNGVDIAIAEVDCKATGTPTPDFQVLKINPTKDVCQAGDEYWMTFEVNENSFLTTYNLTVPFIADGLMNRNNCYFKISVLSEINIGMELPVAQILPDMTQADFIKAWAHMFGVIFQAEPLTNTIQCKQFKEIPKSIPVDWSSKLDIGKPIEVKYRFEDYGQTNNMKYAEGEEVEKKGIGDGAFLINDEHLDQSADVIELPFQSSGSALVLGDLNVASVPMWEASVDVPPVYSKKSVKPRIFALKKVEKRMIYSDGENDEILALEGSIHPAAYFNDIDQDRNLSFETDLRDSNYTELIQALDKCKIVKAYFYLTAADVQNLDFFRQVYVEYFNSMFYVNVVEQYIESRSTLVELVRL